ncbi:SafA/ExsA family spore coat assembly protein [Priestia abyssalis]|uniref:SafA/ExsA family spore coat assembly protein n=1 Tax=Priestia abyssalis TaxID=1221450 RepID=UPI0009955E70|nr:SafA/ExsA family spore coat assembly protein [Priestia abyssalis]
MKIHIVQKGDTLWKIAKKYGVDFEELKKMNSQLSNPDMIMPGMKIKVPSASVSIKKEGVKGSAAGGVKEMPMAEHPFADQTKTYPVTEIDEEPAPQQEMPAKEMPVKPVKEMPAKPVKEMPVKEMPVKEMPIKEMPAPTAPKKEMPVVPKMPVLPKLPPIQPIKQDVDIMNTDINKNFYTLNMSLPPKPPEVPKPAAPAKEMPIMDESSEELVMPAMPQMPMMPQMPHCVPVHPTCVPVPITPIMPGYGYNFIPCVPCPPGAMPAHPYPVMAHQPMYHQPMYHQPMYQPTPMMYGQEMEGAPMMEESPEVMGMQEMGDNENLLYGQMPEYGMEANPSYGMPMNYMPGQQQPMYQQAPMMPEQAVQGAQMMEESPEEMAMPQGYEAAPYMAAPHMAAPYMAAPQMPDCGCGPQPYYPQPMPYGMPQPFHPYGYAPQAAAPFGYAAQPPYGMMGGYMPQQMGMAQPYMQPRMDENDFFGYPDFDEDDDDII